MRWIVRAEVWNGLKWRPLNDDGPYTKAAAAAQAKALNTLLGQHAEGNFRYRTMKAAAASLLAWGD